MRLTDQIEWLIIMQKLQTEADGGEKNSLMEEKEEI